jgi:hypothetical protein
MPHALHDLLHAFHRLGWAWALGIGAIATVGTLALAAVVVRWPTDQFEGEHPRPFMQGRHPLVRAAAIFGQNVAGVVLFVLGFVMALPGVPGQGILTMLIGLTLISFPGKRRLEQWFIRRPNVFRAVNQLRARFGRPPLRLDDARRPPKS